VTGTGAAARRERARQEMREAILDTARRLVAVEGVNALSMRAIARELGYSPAALYEYFPSKEDLGRALFFEGADGLAGLMQRTLTALPPEATAVEAMAAIGRGYRAYARQNPELFRLVFSSVMVGFTPDEAELGRSKGGFDLLVATARRGVESGQFVSMPPEVIATNCWAAVHGFVMLELSGMLTAEQPDCGPDGIPPEALDDLFERNLTLIAHGVLRREPIADSR
jgi:AcrR family transcriptional regulator